MLVPPALGGAGLRASDYARAIGRLGWIDPSLACSVGAHNALVCSALVAHGLSAQASWLRALATGERIGALCLTEVQAGSDLSGIRTKAVRSANGFRLTGSKAYVTNAPDAGLFLVLAKTSALRFGLFVVPRESAGVHVEHALSKAGLHGSPTAIVHFDDVPLDETARLGTDHPNLGVITTSLVWGRCSLAAGALGMLERLLSERDPRLLYARGFVDRCTRAIDAGEDAVAQVTAFAKVVLSETVVDVLIEQLRSGRGSAQGIDLSAWLCDARAFPIFEGTSEVLRLFVIAPGLRGDLRDAWWAANPAVARYVDRMSGMRDAIVQRCGDRIAANQPAWLRLANVALAISGFANVATASQSDRDFARTAVEEALSSLEDFVKAGAFSLPMRMGQAIAERIGSEHA